MAMRSPSARLALVLLLCLSAASACGDGGSGGDSGAPVDAPGGPPPGSGGGPGGGDGGGQPPIAPIRIPGTDQNGKRVENVLPLVQDGIRAQCPGRRLCVHTRIEHSGSPEEAYCRFQHLRLEDGTVLASSRETASVRPGATVVLVTYSRRTAEDVATCQRDPREEESPPTTETPEPPVPQPPTGGGSTAPTDGPVVP
ncbi:hypothetical protein [Thermomonospora cellulosilytica]|uniref:Uncharacterized protein n=1 Tax=Thermomonospora cellulosilytica TaxID=1411118 RepID=A0A7W3MVM2_9ACTN|nr:hypothetical protein [Thermomonospora cellulosilytica]MBA9002726.1 hypothetical protein [Thermomonospora cellulosilytica]